MGELRLSDVWRDINPTKRDYTFFSHPHSVYSRLDYFFMFQRDFWRVQNCNIETMDLSDHTPVSILGLEKKNTIWRLNTGVLNQMRPQIRKYIKDCLNDNDNREACPNSRQIQTNDSVCL